MQGTLQGDTIPVSIHLQALQMSILSGESGKVIPVIFLEWNIVAR